MTISPFEERYATQMNKVFDEETKMKKWLAVEVALAKAHAKIGNISKDQAKKIEEGSIKVKIGRVKEIEKEIDHDLMALVKALSEESGEAGKFVHLGSTSYDIEDTATALIFKDAIELLELDTQKLLDVLRDLAVKHKKTICIGRTHGQHAVPTTYGMKFALYYQETKRNLLRLKNAKAGIMVGKMSGAVGTKATFHGKGSAIEMEVMKSLELTPAKVTNQVIQRDRHAEVLSSLAIFSSLFEKIAKEIRNLQRNEILEVSEYFSPKQVGSSTMPQKRNPHKSERICSIARLVRANVQTALENIALEHERDLTNSANERAIFSESFIATHYILLQITKILSTLEFFPQNIKKNLELTHGLVLSERVMIALTNKGMARQEAHELVRQLAQVAFRNGRHLKDVLKEKTKHFSEKELNELFDYSTYIGEAEKIVEDSVNDVH